MILVQSLFLGFATVSLVQASSQQESELVSSSNGTADLKLLSDKYVNGEFGDQIVGEVINNGTAGAEHVELTFSLYDASHSIRGTEYAVTQPSDILPSERASFVMFIPEDVVQLNRLTHYDIVVDWVNPDGTTEYETLGPEEKTQLPTTIPQDEKSYNDTTPSPPSISELSTALQPSTDGNERCPDGFNVSPSGDCESVTNIGGLFRCPDGYHRSPGGVCETVSSGSTNFMNNASQIEQVLETSGSNDSQNNNVILLVEATQGMTGPPAGTGGFKFQIQLVITKGIKRKVSNSLVLMEMLTQCHLEIMTVRDLLA